MKLSKLALVAVSGLFVAAACGGPAAAPTGSPAPTVGPVGTSSAVATSSAAPSATAGASQPGATETAGQTAGVCALLDLADVSAATGKQYTDASDDGFGQCLWNTTASGNTGDLIVGAVQAQQLAFIKSAFGAGGTDTTVSGHPAFWNPTEGLGSLWVDIGGGRLLVLSFPRSGELDASYKLLAQSLAETAVGNLP